MISGAGILNFMLSLLIVGFICIFCDRLGLLLIAAWCVALLIFVVFRDLSRLLFEWWGVFFFWWVCLPVTCYQTRNASSVVFRFLGSVVDGS